MRVVGRESEIGTLRSSLRPQLEGSAPFILMEGAPGIGKTTLWSAATAMAGEAGIRVLSARASRAETGFAFASLRDLIEPVVGTVIDELPSPQQSAISAAVLRDEPDGGGAEKHTVAIATLNTLRSLSASGPLLLALDDIHWLDQASEQALGFALRRIEDEDVRLVTTRRPKEGHPDPLGLCTLPDERLLRMEVEPLGAAELHQLIHDRLGISVSRPNLIRLHSASAGNPFFALEIVRASDPERWIRGAPIPIPGNLRELVRSRLEALPAEARQAALVVTVAADPTFELLDAVMGPALAHMGMADAVAAQVLEIDHGAPRLAHPLLGEILSSDALPTTVRDMHARLAQAVDDPEKRARHLALAAEGPDEAIAGSVHAAAVRVRSRGATDAAAELAELAARLTPPDETEPLLRRKIDAARYHFEGGEITRARDLLDDVIATGDPGSLRAEALFRLGDVLYNNADFFSGLQRYQRALDEPDAEPRLRARILQAKAFCEMNLGDYTTASQSAETALQFARSADDPEALAGALAYVFFTRFQRGRGVDMRLGEEALALDSSAWDLPLERRPSYAMATVLMWTDRFEESREILAALHRSLIDRGDESAVPVLLHLWSVMEVLAGDFRAAAELAATSADGARTIGRDSARAYALAWQAMTAACLGRADAARAFADENLELAQRVGATPALIYVAQALGFLELSLGDAEGAHSRLGPVATLLAAFGPMDPGLFRFLPDEIEALITLGLLDEAEQAIESYGEGHVMWIASPRAPPPTGVAVCSGPLARIQTLRSLSLTSPWSNTAASFNRSSWAARSWSRGGASTR